MPATPYQLAQDFRAALLRRDADALREITAAYDGLVTSIQLSVSALGAQAQRARVAGQTVNAAWLLRERRLQSLLAQAEQQLLYFTTQLNARITSDQSAAVSVAQVHTQQMLRAAGVEAGFTYYRLPTSAIETLVGFSGDGSPLIKLLNQLPGDATARIRETLLTSVGLGRNPRQTASLIKDALEGNRARALTIARTETLRAYREASRQTAQQAGVTRWMWLSSKSQRTCLACLAMDGQIFKIEKPQPNHPNCRCTVIFLPPGYTPPKRETGAEWFAKQPADIKRQMMSEKAYEAYERGEVELDDFIGVKRSKVWGEMRYERSLKEIEGRGQRRQPPPAPPELPPVVIGPVGKPVSEAIKAPKKGDLVPIIQNALQAINEVHGDGELPVIPIERDRSQSRFGGYWYSTSGGQQKAGKITIRTRDNDHTAITIAHEVGHFLDQQGIGSQLYASPNDSRLAAWRQAIENSRASSELKELARRAGQAGISRKYVRYLSEWVELWARSYSQYIAVRSKNATMLAQLNVLRERTGRVYYPKQWDDDDFEPIAQAFDELMLNLGWRK